MLKKGFTLAEVLITLGIIGIVAALTLPSVIHKHRNKTLETQFKKIYNVLHNATYALINDVPFTTWEGKGLNQIETNIMKLYLTKISGKYCASGSGKNKQCEDFPGWNNSSEHIVINQSAQIQISSHIPDCSFNGWNHGVDNICLCIWVDTNGTKGPNKAGYDRFLFFLSKRNKDYIGLVPAGIDYAPTAYNSVTKECTDPQVGAFAGRCPLPHMAISDSNYFKNLK